jgi:serine/threonine protein kinase/class 3 adenylate cyclase
MELGRYRLLTQTGAGSDGLSYRGSGPDDSPVEIRILSAAKQNPSRWPVLLKRLRLAAMLDTPAALDLRQVDLDHDPPYVVMEWLEAPSLAEAVHHDVPLPLPTVLQLGQEFAAALLVAHRLGLAHGNLAPNQVKLMDSGQLKMDFTSLAVNAGTEPAVVPEVEKSCRSPHPFDGSLAGVADDIYSLAAILYWLNQGRCAQASPYQIAEASNPRSGAVTKDELSADSAPDLQDLLQQMLASEPADRPSTKFVLECLSALADPSASPGPKTMVSILSNTPLLERLPKWSSETGFFKRLGRFRLIEKLGEGGLGKVFRGEDLTDGKAVAIKVMHDHLATRPQAIRRFEKEARLLGEVNNPFVANLIEVNEDDGIHYLVLEFVAGRSMGSWLEEHGKMAEPLALAIMSDVARALVDAHRRGILHRDIKPDNIMLVGGSLMSGGSATGERIKSDSNHSPKTLPDSPRVKLIDFGLARHQIETESLNLTREGAQVGTIQYMSPEQAAGARLDARTDVYAMGATLFHMLAGRPPFLADSFQALSLMHAHEAPPRLQELNGKVSEAVCHLLEKALAKNPEARYADAEALLTDLDHLCRGEATGIQVHPRLPDCQPDKVFQFDWIWDLEASPDQLWPHVSNTERLNRAVGIPSVEFTSEPNPAGGTFRFGKFRKAGFTNVWREHPFEWIEGRKMGVLREYSQGVFKWLMTATELRPRVGGGTTLLHQVRIEPRGWMGRLVAKLEVGIRGRKQVERVYRRIDSFVVGRQSRISASDPFEAPAQLSQSRRRRMEDLLDRLVHHQVEPAVVEKLGDFLLQAPDPEVARIRPLALANRFDLDPDKLVAACLHGAREGLLVLLWDILCPICRIPSQIVDTLRALAEHGHCEACNLDFKLDFGNSVEMIFRVHPEIRGSDLGVYCIGGPVHSPHVAAQIRVGPGETVELDLRLPEGAYRLRGPQLPFALECRVQTQAAVTRADIRLGLDSMPEFPPSLKAGQQLLLITNYYPHELLLRLERTTARENALTAARASSMALFRQLFPGEVLSSGQLVSVGTVTFLVTDLEEGSRLYESLGDARAFSLLHEHFHKWDEAIRNEGGALVKTVGEGVVATFGEPIQAVRVAMAMLLQSMVRSQKSTAPDASEVSQDPLMGLRVGIHRGPALAATINDHLDYFGTTVSQAAQLLQFIKAGEIILTQDIAADQQVAALLRMRRLKIEVLPSQMPGLASPLHRVSLA